MRCMDNNVWVLVAELHWARSQIALLCKGVPEVVCVVMVVVRVVVVLEMAVALEVALDLLHSVQPAQLPTHVHFLVHD